MAKIIVTIFIVLSFLVPTQFAIAERDTSAPLLCSVINVAEYTHYAGCFEGQADVFDLPQFIRIDLQNKTIREVGENTRKRTSTINNFKRMDTKLIMQGIENGRSWSVIVEEETGKMTATASDEVVGFIIFGACTSL